MYSPELIFEKHKSERSQRQESPYQSEAHIISSAEGAKM